MDAQCKAHQEKIEEINTNVKEIRKILLGNGEIGLCEQVRNHESFIRKIKNRVRISDSRRSDLITFAFRACISIVITYIAVRVGLK